MKTLLLILFPLTLSSQKLDDSQFHIYAGNIITGYLGSSAYYWGISPLKSVFIGGAAGFAAGAGKEYIYDRYLKKGTFSKQDMYDTFWGSATGMVFLRVGINEWEKKHPQLDSTQFQFKK